MIKKVLVLLIIFGIVVLNNILFDTGCIFKAITGIPCPSCGMSRAWALALSGNIKGALYYHPLFWIIIVIAVMYFLKEKVNNKIWLLVLVLVIVVYFIRMYLYFPHTIPMDYNKNSLFSSIFGDIR
ncbi:MAG: DUF2752 domain-containing protein [Erysipelotrichaceae bacterium]|nr:DUF2752 domain-containing protein [Erysipelotrichaceae bacterium]